MAIRVGGVGGGGGGGPGGRGLLYLLLQGFGEQQVLLQLLALLLQSPLQLCQLTPVLLFVDVNLLLQLARGRLGRVHDVVHLQHTVPWRGARRKKRKGKIKMTQRKNVSRRFDFVKL